MLRLLRKTRMSVAASLCVRVAAFSLLVWMSRGAFGVQPEFVWGGGAGGVRITNHPDTSMSDWPLTFPIAHAQIRDCVHYVWRDHMMASESCAPGDMCWHYVHELGWRHDDWGRADPGSVGVCIVGTPVGETSSGSDWDNAGNIVVDGAGRGHFVWEDFSTMPLKIFYRLRDPVPTGGTCADIQALADEGICSSLGWGGEFDTLSNLSSSAANSSLCIYRAQNDNEIVHLFYHVGNEGVLHRWRNVGWAGGQPPWELQDWEPTMADTADTIFVPDSGYKAGAPCGAVDNRNGSLHVLFNDFRVADSMRRLWYDSSAAPGFGWSLPIQVGPNDGWACVAGYTIVVDGAGAVYAAFSESTATTKRVAVKRKTGSSSWSDPVFVASESLVWEGGNPPAEARRAHAAIYENYAESREELHVVWTSGEGGSRTIQHRYFVGGDLDDVDQWSAIDTLAGYYIPLGGTGPVYCDVTAAKLHADGDYLFAAWKDYRWREDGTPDSANTEIYFKWFGPNVTSVREVFGPPIGDVSSLGCFAPNPFASTTRAQLEIGWANGGSAQAVQVVVYDVAGRQVRRVIDQSLLPGRYEIAWDGRNDAGSRVASGIYFARVKAAGEETGTRKLIVLR